MLFNFVYDLSGMLFMIFDEDNDLYIKNCGVVFSGGLWFNVCYLVFLNGLMFFREWIFFWNLLFVDGVFLN